MYEIQHSTVYIHEKVDLQLVIAVQYYLHIIHAFLRHTITVYRNIISTGDRLISAHTNNGTQS